jgi:protein SCO1/2
MGIITRSLKNRAVGARRARLVGSILLGGLLLGLVVEGGRALAQHRAVVPPPALLAGVEFRDQRAAAFRVEQLAGSTILLNFVFTRCATVCPTQTRELARLRRALPEQLSEHIAFVSVSLDPTHDTAPELVRFADENGANVSHWSFLATSPEATRSLVERLRGASSTALDEAAGARQAPLERLTTHETTLYLFDRSGRLLQRYVGVPIDQARLLADLEQAVRVGEADSHSHFNL